MSQAKVDRYKEEKKNRQAIMAREKREWAMIKAGGAVLACLAAAWIGISVYQALHPAKTAEAEPIVVTDYTVNVDAIDDYLKTLSEN